MNLFRRAILDLIRQQLHNELVKRHRWLECHQHEWHG